MMRPMRAAILAVGVALTTCTFVTAAGAQDAGANNPTIVLARSAVKPNERVLVEFRGWQARSVTLSLCGNLARRGSSDCDMTGSEGIPLSARSPEVLTEFLVTPPPTPCPCVIRAASPTQDEVAYAPLDLVGHPTGPLVGPRDGTSLELELEVERTTAGFGDALQSSLGGSAPYRLTVTARNRSAETLSGVRVLGWGGRSRTDQSRTLDIPDPGEIGPGGQWVHSLDVDTPAPYIGEFYWQVQLSGAGPASTAEATSRNRPWLLVVLIVVLVADLAAIVGRRIRRWNDERGDTVPPVGDADPTLVIEAVERDERELDAVGPLIS